jgi:lysophospholipase L1-like esterase
MEGTMIAKPRTLLRLAILLFALTSGISAQEANTPRMPAGRQEAQRWVASWGASQQIPEPRNVLPADDLTDATMRQIVHLTLGGQSLRVRLSNAYGTASLHLTAVHIARPVSPASSSIVAGSDRALMFNGAPDVTIPAGAEYISDRVDYSMAPLSDLAITFYEEKPPAQQTSHPGSRATTYYTHGNLVSAEELPGAKTIEHWYTIAGLDVTAAPSAFAIVALGDSITDGRGSTTNGNDRWPDVLARSLQGEAKTRTTAVVNVGTGGNRLLADGLGPNVLARFDRDVLARAGVRYLMVFEGVNDLGSLHGAQAPGAQPPPAPSAKSVANEPAQARPEMASGTTQQEPAPAFSEATQQQHDELVKSIVAAYEQIVTRAHAAGICAIGATITPFGGSGYGRSPANEADREKINAWILAPGNFDAVVDFAKVVADPQDSTKLAARFDSGDHLHPSAAGYRAMGESIPLTLFVGP